jgi:DNA polymerase-3 subunit delta
MQSFLQRAKKRITPAAQRLLVDYIGFNLGILKNSLQMLLNYLGEREIIEEQDVIELIVPTKEEGVFALAEKLTNAPAEDVLFFLNHLLEQGVHPLVILSVLAKEVRCLMEIKEIIQQKNLIFTSYNQFIKTAYPLIKKENLVHLKGLPPYVIFLFCQRAQKYSLKVLKAIHQQLLLTEVAMKSTSKNVFYHLEMLALFWCKVRGG